MRKTFKIMLATGVILGLCWISVVLAAVFVLVFIAKTVLARGGQGLPDAFSEDEIEPMPWPKYAPNLDDRIERTMM